MIDQAGIMMAQGAAIASERIAGVNDNMTQPHYHNYYEIYYLEEGERYQRIQDELYMLKAGELMLFSPYIMHYSYGAQDMPFRRVIHYIHYNYAEPITLESLAEQFYISAFHLCREFKAYTNSTVIRYVNVTRIMNAQRMFLETDKNITEISRETGFSNLTHFNRVFKSVTGMTPSGYRKSHRNFEIYVGGKI